MTRFAKWLFWTVVYRFRRRPAELAEWLLKTKRCRAPWKKFRPSVYHNADAKCWYVYFTDERDYVDWPPRTIYVGYYTGQESGNIVGLIIRDEALVRKDTGD